MNLEALRDQLALLPTYLSNHLLLTVVALSVGIAMSIPLAVLVLRIRALQGPVLALASVVQTIPSLALLALMVPLLGRIGFLPAVIALTLYSVLPVLRNTVTGILGIDADITEAARGIGMTNTQMLLRVQLPLASPVIIAGIRTATVWVVGIATLSTPVGATSLGNYIFSGLQTQNMTAVLVGCAAAAVLAITLDLLIRLMEVAATRRSAALGLTAAALVAATLIGGLWPLIGGLFGADVRPRATVGAKTFTEQYILARLISDRLDEAGYRVATLDSLGSTVVFDALAAGRIDCYVDYTGTIWANYMNRDDTADPETVLREMSEWLEREHGIVTLGPLGFENAYALAMRREHADRLGIRTIADLATHAPQMSIGGDYEFFARPEWAALRQTYGLSFRDQREMDSTLMYAAVARAQVDVISAFSTDGRIAAFDLAVLQDPRRALPPYDAVLLLSADAMEKPGLARALEPLLGAIPDEAMREANMLVDEEGRPIREAAARLRHAVEQALESRK